MKTCKHCEKIGHPRTLYGMSIGYFCCTCFATVLERAKKTCQKAVNAMRRSIEDFVERESNTCDQCGDGLTGHEDERGKTCRWCVTCTEVTEGESIAARK